MNSDMIKRFEDICGKENVISDMDIRVAYSEDETPAVREVPSLVLRPRTEREISDILKICNANRIPVTARGRGTSVVGGSVSAKNGVILSLERMDSILSIDPETMTARVEPAVITSRISEDASKYNLFYPVDPASHESCSIGGNVNTGASGMKAVKYGATKDNIVELKFIMADGSIIRTGRNVRKNVAGYNLLGLMIGSEGTLGIVTEITVKLLPLPKHFASILVGFENLKDAANASTALLQSGFSPNAIEFYDKNIITIISEDKKKELPLSDMGAHLIVQFDSQNEQDLEDQYMKAGEFLFEKNAVDILVATQRPLIEKLWSIRRGIRDAVRALSPILAAEDVAVPINRIADLVENIEAISEKWGYRIVTFGHAGDGNAHVDILKEDKSLEDWNRDIDGITLDVLKAALDLGGTITGEHGIGQIKNKYMREQFSNEELHLFKRIKTLFDPNGILNPGKAI